MKKLLICLMLLLSVHMSAIVMTLADCPAVENDFCASLMNRCHASERSPTISSIYQVLSKGSRGEDVAILQQRLSALGYNVGTIDGIFGAKTEDAVKAFQRENGLPDTGAVHSTDLRLLFPEAPGAAIVTLRPTLRPAPTAQYSRDSSHEPSPSDVKNFAVFILVSLIIIVAAVLIPVIIKRAKNSPDQFRTHWKIVGAVITGLLLWFVSSLVLAIVFALFCSLSETLARFITWFEQSKSFGHLVPVIVRGVPCLLPGWVIGKICSNDAKTRKTSLNITLVVIIAIQIIGLVSGSSNLWWLIEGAAGQWICFSMFK